MFKWPHTMKKGEWTKKDTHTHNPIIRSWCCNSYKDSIRNSSRFIFSQTTSVFRGNYLPSSLPSALPYFVSYRVIGNHTFGLKDR
jgi:hypothetical protein